MLAIILIKIVTCTENVFDMDFGDELEKEKGSEIDSPSFKFEGKNKKTRSLEKKIIQKIFQF